MTDVAVQNLMDARNNYSGAMDELADTGLYITARDPTQKLFKKLSEHTAFSAGKLDQTFESIFASLRKFLHEFYDDPQLNPD